MIEVYEIKGLENSPVDWFLKWAENMEKSNIEIIISNGKFYQIIPDRAIKGF